MSHLLRQGVWLNAMSLVCGGTVLAALLLPGLAQSDPTPTARLLFGASLLGWIAQTAYWIRVGFDAALMSSVAGLSPDAAANRIDEDLLESGLAASLPLDGSWRRRCSGMRRLFFLQAGALVLQLVCAAGASWA